MSVESDPRLPAPCLLFLARNTAMARRRLLLVLTVLLCGGGVKASEPSHPLILQLGDAEFERRIAAERALMAHGVGGLTIIEAGTHSIDPEIRQRSIRLLELMRKTAFIQQRDRIRQDPWTVPAEMAPGWEAYQSFVGDSWDARDLYVRMIEAEGDLMLAVALRPKRWVEDFERRCADLRPFLDRRQQHEVNPISVLALLFLAEHPDHTLNMVSAQIISGLLSDPSFFMFIQNAPAGEAAVSRALLSEWVLHSNHGIASQRLDLAIKYQLPAGEVAAREIISNRHAAGASRAQLQNAIRFISIYEPASAVSVLEPLLSSSQIDLSPSPRESLTLDPPLRQTSPPSQEQQANDLALLGLLQITRQDPQLYGYANIRIDLEHRFNNNAPIFTAEGDRQQALLRWQSWRAAHPLYFTLPAGDASEGWQL